MVSVSTQASLTCITLPTYIHVYVCPVTGSVAHPLASADAEHGLNVDETETRLPATSKHKKRKLVTF